MTNSSPSDSGRIDVRVHPPSGTIVLHHPATRNSLTQHMLEELLVALDDLHRQLSVRAVILTGAGDFFCSGLDLSELRQRASQRDPQAAWGKDARQWHDLVETMLRFPKPIIAAVNGPALAAGAGLVLAADLVVACRHAQLSFPEARRGLVAGVATPLLCFRLGAARAAQLLLRAQPTDPAVLNQWGLYHDVVQPDQVWARAHQWAQEMAELSPQSLSLTKRLLNEEVGEPLMTLLAVGAATSATAYTTDAAREGIDAFLQQRRPQWPGVEPA